MRRSNRINKLPKEILCRILSFLTTKEAVATSILSKRWIRLWISVPNLNFTNIRINSIKSSYKFNEFVYSVLASRDAAGYNVDSFHLDIQYATPQFAYHRSFPHVVRWINVLVRRNLKHLHLNHEIDEQDTDDVEQEAYLPQLPRSILTCRTLVSLKLRRFSVEGFFVSNIEFGFPSLKTLHFDNIYFGNGRNFVLLLSGCPVLEDLQLLNSCQTLSSQDPDAIQMFQSLSLPKLTRAVITESLWSHFPLKALSTVKSLSLDTLKLYTHDQTDDEGDDEENPLQRTYIDIPIFHNLTHLKLHNSWDLVVQMLHHCPKLQSLELSKGLVQNRGREDDQENLVEEPELVPQCVSSCLRTCTVRNVGGLQSELMLPTFILKNARILQTMKVWSEWNQRQSEIEEKLSPCPKASATCQLFVY